MTLTYLHVHDCSAVSCLIPEQEITITRFKNVFSETYPQFKVIPIGVRPYLIFLFFYILYKRPKELWFHSSYTEFRLLIRFKKLFGSPKIIYWSHGSDLRGKSIPKFLDKADILYKSTNSIKDPRFILRPVPVDTKLFYPERKTNGSALHISCNKISTQKVEKYCQAHNLDLLIIDNHAKIEHRHFAKILRKVKYYFEAKNLFPERSKCYYEAKASGCIVIEENVL